MESTDGSANLEEISTTECIELLRTERVGRIGVVVRGHPEMFPVNYALDASDTVVLRTADGRKLAAAVNHHVVFEVDRFDTSMREGWSVIVHGVAHQTGSVAEGERLLMSWRHDASHLVRIVQTSVTGRRIHQLQ